MQVADLIRPETIILTGGLSAIGIMVRGVLKRQDKHGEKLDDLATDVTSLKVTLIGIDGQNGLRSEVRELQRRASE